VSTEERTFEQAQAELEQIVEHHGNDCDLGDRAVAHHARPR